MQNSVAQTTIQSGQVLIPGSSRTGRWTTERRFYFGMTLFLTAGLLLGFARTFFLKPWFQDWAKVHGAPEPFFAFHGAVFVAWFTLLFVQISLIGAGRIRLHRQLGLLGAMLGALMVVVGVLGSLIAAKRPTGFIDVPMPALEFLVLPFGNSILFGTFFALAILKRRKPQSHKRLILIATMFLMEAAVARWPFSFMTMALPIPRFTMLELGSDLFLLPLIAWDLYSERRLHPVTLWGGLTLITFQFTRFIISGTAIWLAFAAWAIGLIG
jgi:hypothetical protein